MCAMRRAARTVKQSLPVATEFQEQCAVVQWWALYGPAHGLDVRLLIASANGAHLAGDAQSRAIKMRKLKAAGLRAGCPDLLLAVPRRNFCGLWLEVKRSTWVIVRGAHENDQAQYLSLLRGMGYTACFAAGAEKAIYSIKKYLEG